MEDTVSGGLQAMAGSIFTDMVIEQAIKDKTEMVEKEMMAGQTMSFNMQQQEHQEEEGEGSDIDDELDDFMDEESEKIMRGIREARMAAMKEQYEEQQYNKTMGHGTYQEIVEAEFLPVVTKTRFVCVAFFHKDFERCKIIDMHLHKICVQHPEARFVRLDAEKAPFFINKL